jgi:hypothetical protein
MTMKIAVPALVLASVASILGATAAWPAPASERQIVNSQTQTKGTVRMTALRNYNAGYRTGLSQNLMSSRAAYNRGYSDGFNTAEVRPALTYQEGNTGYIGVRAVYPSDVDVEAGTAYGNSRLVRGDDNRLLRVMNESAFQFYQTRQRMAYCTQRYRSFDAASGTFLANDGNRYNCL